MSEIFPDGNGIFETIKVIDGRCSFINEHLERAERSAQILGMDFPLRKSLLKRIEANIASHQIGSGEGRLRVSFSRTGEVEASYSPYVKWNRAAQIVTSDWLVHESSPIVGIKALPFRSHLAAIEKARFDGFDEIVRFNTSGFLCEGATANLLVRLDGNWITPNLASGCLPGIIRAFFIDHLAVKEQAITRDEFEQCDAIFLTSSLREIQPVSQVDERLLEIDEAFLRNAEQELESFR
ncbi:MAG: aminotransferase class IV [Actinomycetota bacterium]